MNMLTLFPVGSQIGGYCNGFFGRDDYEDKICVMTTPKYSVFQYEDGTATVLNYDDRIKDCLEEGDWKYSTEEGYKYG